MDNKTFAIIGYACDEGVRRNQGRVGASEGPVTIREQLGKMPNHLEENVLLSDVGNILCADKNMEKAQLALSSIVSHLLNRNVFPILLGGGHDIAYGNYKGILGHLPKGKTIGIINFDAHFDLRTNENGNNSGTPFFQISEECRADNAPFNYMCLGIREDANDKTLFKTAHKLGVDYLKTEQFTLNRLEQVKRRINLFIQKVHHIYVTIDLDGFSSAYAPGVSAASPMGFAPDIVLEALKVIVESKKMISLDIAEMNPTYDIDGQTAKLAAALIHFVIHAY